jgi:hypothetical protein
MADCAWAMEQEKKRAAARVRARRRDGEAVMVSPS